MFLNAQDGKFPRFFQENSGSREMAFGNANIEVCIPEQLDIKCVLTESVTQYKTTLKDSRDGECNEEPQKDEHDVVD